MPAAPAEGMTDAGPAGRAEERPPAAPAEKAAGSTFTEGRGRPRGIGMIEARNLTKWYGDRIVVDDLSFTVEDGTICGFLGPNGAGKTTTMNMLTGYTAPSSGEILINGHSVLEEPAEAKRTVGYLPEQPPLYNDMTVEEYLGFAAELKGVPGRDRKEEVRRVMREMGLEESGRRLIRNLSKGFRQRVGFAQAIIGNPETLILDEPTNGLDPKQMVEIRELIRRLGGKHTIILSSHILSEVSGLCDEVLILSHGELAARGDPRSIRPGGVRDRSLYLEAEGDPEAIRRALDKVTEIREGDFSVSGADTVQVKIPLPAGESGGESGEEGSHGDGAPAAEAALRREVSRALVEAGAGILEMRTETASLEDIFLRVTEDEDEKKMSAREAAALRDGDPEARAEEEEAGPGAGEASPKKQNAAGKLFGRIRRRHDSDL